MAIIENAESLEGFKAALKQMNEGELLAQELVQQGAIHALQQLLLNGCTAELCAEMISSAMQLGEHVKEECRARNMPTVDIACEAQG